MGETDGKRVERGCVFGRGDVRGNESVPKNVCKERAKFVCVAFLEGGGCVRAGDPATCAHVQICGPAISPRESRTMACVTGGNRPAPVRPTAAYSTARRYTRSSSCGGPRSWSRGRRWLASGRPGARPGAVPWTWPNTSWRRIWWRIASRRAWSVGGATGGGASISWTHSSTAARPPSVRTRLRSARCGRGCCSGCACRRRCSEPSSELLHLSFTSWSCASSWKWVSISRVVATTISRYLAGVIRQRLWAEATHTEKGAKREGRVRVVSHSKQRLWVRQNLSVTLSLDDLCARPPWRFLDARQPSMQPLRADAPSPCQPRSVCQPQLTVATAASAL